MQSSLLHLPFSVLLVSNVPLLEKMIKREWLKRAELSPQIPQNTGSIVRNKINSVKFFGFNWL